MGPLGRKSSSMICPIHSLDLSMDVCTNFTQLGVEVKIKKLNPEELH
jgi:hypothetical protein